MGTFAVQETPRVRHSRNRPRARHACQSPARPGRQPGAGNRLRPLRRRRHPRSPAPAQTEARNAAAFVMLNALAPADPLQAMLASQAVALHYAAMACFRRACETETAP